MNRFWRYLRHAFGIDDEQTMLFRDRDAGTWVEYQLIDGKLEVIQVGSGELPRRWR